MIHIHLLGYYKTLKTTTYGICNNYLFTDTLLPIPLKEIKQIETPLKPFQGEKR